MKASTAWRGAALIALVLAVPFVALTCLVAVHFSPLLGFDRSVVDDWHGGVVSAGWLHPFTVIATAFEPLAVDLVMAAVAVVLLLRRTIRVAVCILVTMGVAAGLGRLIKDAVERHRPLVAHQISGWSYPSGHAVTIAAACALLVVLTSSAVRRRAWRLPIVGLWVVIAALVGCDRVIVAAHFPSDVVGGWLLGGFIALVVMALFKVRYVESSPARRRALPLSGEPRRTLAVILNPSKADATAFRAWVDDAAVAAGWTEPLWFETTIEDAGGSMAQAAIAAGVDVIVAAGGDGTVRVIAAEVAGTGIPLGILPMGTGNLLARNLGLPLSPPVALRVVLDGVDRPVDLVHVDGDGLPPTKFSVMAGMGLDAAIMNEAPEIWKTRVGWPAYFLTGARHLSYPAIPMEIIVDDAEPIRRLARTVVVGNVGSLTARIPLLPDALIDDGVLDVVVVAPRRLFGWVGVAARILTKHPRRDASLDRFTGQRVVVRAEKPAPRQLDGDTFVAGLELRAEVEPGVLLVRVPS